MKLLVGIRRFILRDAETRHRAAAEEFRDAGGDRVLGVCEVR